MAKQRRVKARVEINLSTYHIGLSRVFNELAQIEDDNKLLGEEEIKALKRRYMLSILYQYSSDSSAPTLTPINVIKKASDHQMVAAVY